MEEGFRFRALGLNERLILVMREGQPVSGTTLSLKSRARLLSCHPELQRVVNYAEAWMPFPFQVMEGYRSPARQKRLYSLGRKQEGERWVVADPSQVVTHCDGQNRLSKHNIDPSQAVSLAPYPADWSDRDRFHIMAGVMLSAAAYLRISIRWGSEWADPMENEPEPAVELLGHFQLNRSTY